jgi:hypothetical protein
VRPSQMVDGMAAANDSSMWRSSKEMVSQLWTGQWAALVGVASDEELHEMEIERLRTAPCGDKAKGLVVTAWFGRAPHGLQVGDGC